MIDLRNVLARTLAAQGALVDTIHPDGLEIFAPPTVQEALGLPEWSRIGFGSVLPEQAVRVSFESEWAQRLMRLLGQRGTHGVLDLSLSLPSPRDLALERELSHVLALANATFRLGDVAPARTCYFLLVFHVTSTSDDKREDIVYLCLNEASGAAADRLTGRLLAKLREKSESTVDEPAQVELPLALSGQRIRELSGRLLPARIRSILAPFLAGMERRMARDLERLHAYHTGLRSEAAARIEDKKRKGEDPRVVEAEQSRLQAIEREYHAKVADLDRKYAMSVDIKLVQAVRAQMPVLRADLFLLRRKGIRKAQMDWNPLVRGFEPLVCESCFGLPTVFHVCDDKLHYVCQTCIPGCPNCAKVSCKACHPGKCPKCGHAWGKLQVYG